MRAFRDVSPAVRAVVTVAATSLFMVLVAWATLIGPDQVFTGPGPRPARRDLTTPTSCIPLPVVTARRRHRHRRRDPTTSTSATTASRRARASSDYRDLVEQHPPPLWLKVLV